MTTPMTPDRRQNRRVVVAALGAAAAASLALAQPGQPGAAPAMGEGAAPAAAPSDVEALLAAIADAPTLEEAITARARLIDLAPDDERAPTWMVEQAAAVLDRIAADGSEAAVLLGIPTARQRERAEEAAAEALMLIARADDAATRIVERVQARLIDGTGSPEAVRRRAQEAERTLARLVDLEQGIRIPYFRGRAAVVLSAVQASRASREEFARVALESLGKLKLGTVAAEASRRVALAAVLLNRGERDAPAREQARTLLRWVVEQPVHAGGGGAGSGAADVRSVPDPVTRAQAWMGLMLAAGSEEELRAVREDLALAAITEPFVVADAREPSRRAADPLLALLVAEAATRASLAMVEAGTDGRERAAKLDAAFAPLLTLLRREDLREHRAALRPLVLAKVGSATDRLMPMDRLDAMVPLSRAVMLARGSSPGDRARVEAAALLRAVADRHDAGEARPEALWELAVILWESPEAGDAVAAVETLCRLAAEFPESARAAEAAKKAVELSRYTLGQLAAGEAQVKDGADPALVDKLGTLYARALDLAVKLAPADPDSAQQRLERARLVLDAAAVGSERAMTPEELDSALNALEGVPESDPRRAEADRVAAVAIDRALEAARTAVARAVEADAGREELAPAARERLVGIARRAVQWAQSRRPSEADRYRLVLADALIDAGDARAAAIYQDLADRAAPGSELRVRARLGLGRAQRARGQNESAFATLRSLVDDLERAASQRRPPTKHRPEAYWLAWAEMLEILAADNRDGRRSDVIRLQINRLELVDPAFGGGEASRRISAVRSSIDGK